MFDALTITHITGIEAGDVAVAGVRADGTDGAGWWCGHGEGAEDHCHQHHCGGEYGSEWRNCGCCQHGAAEQSRPLASSLGRLATAELGSLPGGPVAGFVGAFPLP
jgi:hypothetical protein